MVVDPIADMLTRIRNAQAVSKPEVVVPFSKMNFEIAKILEKEGFIESVKKVGRGTKRNISLVLKYNEGRPYIIGLKRISKPGQRIYLSARDLKPVRGGFGIRIISTPKGLMTNKQARKKNLGGEIICEIW
jgi:small subunit ribosomal protein S8